MVERSGNQSSFLRNMENHTGAAPAQTRGNWECGRAMWVVMTTIGLVMLIACMNVVNLLMVRAEARQQELSIRVALGAGRGQIARVLLLESAVLGRLGGVVGVGIAYAALRLLLAIGPPNLPGLNEIALDARSLGFALILSMLSGLVLGLIPAFKYTGLRARSALAGASRTVSASRERQRSRNVRVVGQVAMALVLLVSAMLMIRTFESLRHIDPGFTDAEHLQTIRISIPPSLISDPQMILRIQSDILDKLQSVSLVTSVGFASARPWKESTPIGTKSGSRGRTTRTSPRL